MTALGEIMYAAKVEEGGEGTRPAKVELEGIEPPT